jgi:hypothetical protein
MKNTPIHVCAKTAFAGEPSTESGRNDSLELILNTMYCPTIIILENTLN